MSPVKKTLILGLFLNGLLLTNPFNFLLIVICFAVYLPIKLFLYRDRRFFQEFKIISIAIISSLPLLLQIYNYLSTPPGGTVSVAPKFYVKTTPDVSLIETAFSIGPIFFLGIIGAISLLFKKNKNNHMSVLIFLIIWPVIQLILFLFGNSLKIHPPRVFSGLYYLPLAYFSAEFIYRLTKNHLKQLVIIALFFLLTFPNYYLSYKELLYAFTDFKYFSSFVYPSIKQVAAFKFLEKNTPPYSEVLALFEAGSLINGFSGNTTEVSLNQDFKIPFYSNKLDSEEALKILKKNHYEYVYFGFQEKSYGGNMDHYPFLKKIYENEEVNIYKIL
jgi:hypothetical protein